MEKMRDGESRRTSCEGCDLQRPDILAENVDAWDLWENVQSQWRASGFGLIGLDYLAVRMVAELIGIKMDEGILQKLQLLEALTLNKLAEESEAK
jgi:hypothetical protein